MRRAGPAQRRKERRREPKASGRSGRQTKCRRPDLADSQAAVTWRYEPVRQYPEAGLLQQPLGPFGETPVQKAAAGQHHRFLTCPPGHLQGTLGKAIVKVGRDQTRRAAPLQQPNGFTHPGPPVNASRRPALGVWLVDQRNVERCLFIGIGEVFKPHRGFSLVRGVMKDAGKRRPGVKKTSGAGRCRSTGPGRLESRNKQLPLGR